MTAPRLKVALGLAIAATLWLVPRPALAGRARFAWLYGTELNPERGVELETWVYQENDRGPTKDSESDLWWGPVVALNPHLELVIPIEAENHDFKDGSTPATNFTRFGGELRYRPQSPDPIDAGPFVTLLRASVKRIVDDEHGTRFEADVVESYQRGKLFAEIDMGAIDEHFNNATDTIEVRPGAGVSYRVFGDVRLGIETYGELAVHNQANDESWMVIGPSISLTSGRFWGAASVGAGFVSGAEIADAGRIKFGVAL